MLSKDVSNEGGFVRALLHAADTGAALFLCPSGQGGVGPVVL